MTSSTSCARAAAKSAASAHGAISTSCSRSSARTRSPSSVPPGSRVATTFAAVGAQRLDEQLRLRRLAAAVDSLERHEHSAGGYGRRSGERIRSVESSYAPTFDAARWRTATIVVSALAALELALLVAIGVTVLGKSVAHRVQGAALAKAAGVQPVHEAGRRPGSRGSRAATRTSSCSTAAASRARPGIAADSLRARGYRITSVGNAKKQSSSTRTLVMYRPGYRAEAARLARDVHTSIVAPLDGMRPRRAHGRAGRARRRALAGRDDVRSVRPPSEPSSPGAGHAPSPGLGA